MTRTDDVKKIRLEKDKEKKIVKIYVDDEYIGNVSLWTLESLVDGFSNVVEVISCIDKDED